MFLKKLPLPFRIGLGIALVMAALAAYHMLVFVRGGSQGSVSSLDAYVCGGLTEIKTGLSGQVRRIVANGEKVRKGDLLLEIATEKSARAKEAAEAQLQETLPRLSPVALKILEGYHTLPEDSSALQASLETALTAVENASDRVTALSLAHAKSQLELRKLELKNKRSAKEQEQLKLLQAEDYRLGAALEQAREEHEAISNQRAALEASLRTRKLLEQSAAALNGQQQQLLATAQAAFARLAQAEGELAGSRRFAPADGTIIKTVFQPGDVAEADRLALILEPDNEESFWLIASFSAQDAEFAVPDAKCKISFSDGSGIVMSGRVTGRIYPDDDLLLPEEAATPALASGSGAGEAHFRISLHVYEPEMLLYLQGRPDAQVTIIKGSESKSFIDELKKSATEPEE